MSTLKSFEKCVLEELLAKLRLEKAKQEFGNDYVFGFDDVERILTNQIEILDEVVKEQNRIEESIKKDYIHCWGLKNTHEDHSDCERCCLCKTSFQKAKNKQCVSSLNV